MKLLFIKSGTVENIFNECEPELREVLREMNAHNFLPRKASPLLLAGKRDKILLTLLLSIMRRQRKKLARSKQF